MRLKTAALFLIGFLLLAGLAGKAQAVTFTLDDFDVTAYNPPSSGDGLAIEWEVARSLSLPESFDLELNQSATFALFDIWTPETSVNKDDLTPQDITVAMYFSAPPPPFSGEVTGDTSGNRLFCGLLQYGAVEWDGPVTYYFGPHGDGELLVTLSDETFNWGLFGLWPGECLGGTVEATFTLVKTASVPDASLFLLLGPALLALGSFGRKRTQ